MILVVGSSGLLGGMITRQLLANNRPVRILVRSNPAYQLLIDADARPVAGDLKEPASLTQACAGVNAGMRRRPNCDYHRQLRRARRS